MNTTDYNSMIPASAAVRVPRRDKSSEVSSNAALRSKSIEHNQSETTSVMLRKKGLQSAVMEALELRKRTGQVSTVSNKIPMRSSYARSGVGSNK